MRFRLFRSRAFWFGVPGLVFLLWGWWVSMGHASYAGFGGPSHWTIGQCGGEVFVRWHSGESPDWRIFKAGHEKASVEQLREWKDDAAEYWTTSGYFLLPYRLLVLYYLAVWAGLLTWRKRKIERRPVE